MPVLELDERKAALVRAGLATQRKIMEIALRDYETELSNFEKEYQMSTGEFLHRFNSGELGDDEQWFDWLFAYEAVEHLKEQLSLVDSIDL